MPRITLNRLGKAEEQLLEEQVGFTPKQSTTEQMFNIRLLTEKYIDHQQDLYHKFNDLKRRSAMLGMKGFGNMNEELVEVIETITQSCTIWRTKVLTVGVCHHQYAQFLPGKHHARSSPRISTALSINETTISTLLMT